MMVIQGKKSKIRRVEVLLDVTTGANIIINNF